MAKKDKNDVHAGSAQDVSRITRRAFPGPAGARAALRVHFSRRAYADITAHAKESLEAEVCGVLVGEVSEDEEGYFLEVHVIVRGNAAREARAHVTFTQETWTQIHATMDKDYPEFQITGWYHTHPGFGVEFSAMDLFIQENFFPGKTQVAFLTDPLGGDVSLCFNGASGIEYLTRFWVDGREHRAKTPEGTAAAGAASLGDPDVRGEIERLESRINQLINAYDEQRRNFHRMLTTTVAIVCSAVLLLIGYQLYVNNTDRVGPPRSTRNYVPVPVKIGEQTVMIGVEVVDWQVPRSLDALLDKVARAEAERLAAERAHARESPRPWYIRLLEWARLRNPPAAAPSREGEK